MDNFIIYILQVAVCQVAFYLLFHFALKNHSFFQANRVYLLFTTIISFIIPLLSFEVWQSGIKNEIVGFDFALITAMPGLATPQFTGAEQEIVDFWPNIFMSAMFIIYLFGSLFHVIKIAHGLIQLRIRNKYHCISS